MAKTAVKTKTKAPTQPPAFAKGDLEIRWLPVSKLVVKWVNAQRKEKAISHAKRIAGQFDPDKFGILAVTMADDSGNYHVVDGVHRSTAVRIMWGDDEQVPCQILPTKDPVRAAEIFLGMNKGRRPVTAVDNFRASVTAGDPDSVMINNVVRACGYRIEQNKASGCIAAINALYNVHRSGGPDVLRAALTLIQATWGLTPEAVNGPIIQAYGWFVRDFGNRINYGRLKTVISKRFATPSRLLMVVKGVRELSGGSATDVLYDCLLDNYNKGLKTGQLK